MRGSLKESGAGRVAGWFAGAILVSVAAMSCSDGGVTAPSIEGRSVTGAWSGSGSLYQDIGWDLMEHLPGDSITGTGYLDAPNFLDGFPEGPQPRYRIRGERDGLFISLRFVPDEPDDTFVLRFEGVVQADGRLRGEIFPRSSEVRLDVVRVRLAPGS